LDAAGRITDRRAGRISDDLGRELAAVLDEIDLGPGVRCDVRHVKQYRACLVLRGPDLDGHVADTDPQSTGVPPLSPRAFDPAAERTAQLVAQFIAKARDALAGQPQANGITLRGFDSYHPLPSFEDLYLLNAVAVAAYPMYRGVARLAGMQVRATEDDPDRLAAQVRQAEEHDFVFLHYKSTDSRGEDGDFEAKVREIERADRLLAEIQDGFDVVMVTGDHSTPWSLRSHSWHPVPVLVWSDRCRRHQALSFGETSCLFGSLGQIRSIDVLPLVLAHAGRLKKFGA